MTPSPTLLAIAVFVFTVPAVVAAPPVPGETLGRGDVDRVRDLLSPGVARLLERGMEMAIGAYEPIPDPPAYREATEKFSAQVRLDDTGVLDESSYVAGRPFPTIDANDPQAPLKIMYNFERSRYFTDDLTVRLTDAETGSILDAGRPSQRLDVEKHFILDAFRTLKYVGRTENQPLPAYPNPSGLFTKSGMFPILEPVDLQGIGGLTYRYLDHEKQDNTWIYVPQIRRVRVISTANRSEALFGQEIDIDSFGGFAGQIPWFEWKLLAVKPMLVARHGRHLPPRPCESDGGVTFCDRWEVIPVAYVVEGRPKISGYAYSKRVIVLDAESGFVAYTDVYDSRGELWKVGVNYSRYSTKPNPNADLEYPFAREFIFGFVMVDLQTEHATRAAIPGIGFADHPGWFINQGEQMDVGEEWFTIAALIRAAK